MVKGSVFFTPEKHEKPLKINGFETKPNITAKTCISSIPQELHIINPKGNAR